MDDNATEYLARLDALDNAAETALLNAILMGGYDQGCFLRPRAGDLIPNAPGVADAVLAALDTRGVKVEPTENDPFEQQRLSASSVPGNDSGYVVLTQGCDLIRGLSLEPFVELARVDLTDDRDLIAMAKKNSPRYLHVVDGPGLPKSGWVVDLRQRVLLAKDKLVEYPVVQVIPDEQMHKRFKMRVGQRYSRDALPTDLVEKLQNPMRELLRKPTLMKKAGVFSDFLVFRRDAQAEVIPVIEPGANQRGAEDAWDELEREMGDELRAVIHEDSGAVPIDQINWWRYTRGWKMDLDDISYHRKAGTQASPTI